MDGNLYQTPPVKSMEICGLFYFDSIPNKTRYLHFLTAFLDFKTIESRKITD